jgi:hypothetical protein
MSAAVCPTIASASGCIATQYDDACHTGDAIASARDQEFFKGTWSGDKILLSGFVAGKSPMQIVCLALEGDVICDTIPGLACVLHAHREDWDRTLEHLLSDSGNGKTVASAAERHDTVVAALLPSW